MPNYCVVFGCSNIACTKNRVSLFKIPFRNDDRPEAKRRRKLWVNFVTRTRKKWKPGTNSSICSAHFTEESFQRRFNTLPGMSGTYVPMLMRDDFGINASPSVYHFSRRYSELY